MAGQADAVADALSPRLRAPVRCLRRCAFWLPMTGLIAVVLLWPLTYSRNLTIGYDVELKRNVIIIREWLPWREVFRLKLPLKSNTLSLDSGEGYLAITRYTPGVRSPVEGGRHWFGVHTMSGTHGQASGGSFGTVERLTIAYWLIGLPLFLVCVPQVMDLVARRRSAQGRCAHCHYDLRATPDRCPECGRTVAVTGADAPK